MTPLDKALLTCLLFTAISFALAYIAPTRAAIERFVGITIVLGAILLALVLIRIWIA